MASTITPIDNSHVDVKNKNLKVKIRYINNAGGIQVDKKLQWELDDDSKKLAKFRYREILTDPKGSPNAGDATNFIRPQLGAKSGDKITFTITDITDENNKLLVMKVNYIFENIVMSGLENPLGAQAYSTYGDTVDIGKENYYLELQTTVTDNNITPKKNVKINFNAPEPIQFFSGTTKDTLLENRGGKGVFVETDNDGLATVYLGSLNPGEFNIVAKYSAIDVNDRIDSTDVYFIDDEPYGELPPLELDLKHNVLDLDDYPGKYYEVKLPTSLSNNSWPFDVKNVSCTIIVNDNVVKNKKLYNLMLTDISLAKDTLDKEGENSIYYLLTDKDGNSWSCEAQRFTVIGNILSGPDDNIPRPLEPLIGTVLLVNIAAIRKGLKLKIPNYKNKMIGDKIHITVYVNGYENRTNTPKNNIFELSVIDILDSNLHDEIEVSVSQEGLSGYSVSADDAYGTFQAEYAVVQDGKPNVKIYSQILSLRINTYGWNISLE
ncbi:MAG: hypothetical protein LBI71_06165 [Enterobacteriaceae bacterium]|jgi:hypothetical protein|nr:hypothetical protein [Enterobacteriaceae bacterium]